MTHLVAFPRQLLTLSVLDSFVEVEARSNDASLQAFPLFSPFPSPLTNDPFITPQLPQPTFDASSLSFKWVTRLHRISQDLDASRQLKLSLG